MPDNPVKIGPYLCGRGAPLLVIAGPCVLETAELALTIAHGLAEIAQRLPVQIIFKASFDKANRTSTQSFRGPAWRRGSIYWLASNGKRGSR